jgi:two-component system LytT family response regulator
MSAASEDHKLARGSGSDGFTPQAVLRTLSRMAERAAKASDETLTSAVTTGRMALAEWQDLAGRLRKLEADYERLALSESRAVVRLQDALDLLDKFVEPSRLASTPIRSGRLAQGGPARPRPRPCRDTHGVMAIRMLGVFELAIDGRQVTHWHGQRTQSLMQFLAAHRHRRVLRDELIAAVWPDADEPSGRHRLHQAVYELRSTLRAIDPDRSPIVCADGGYGIDDEVPVWVDVEEFDDLAATASRCFTAQQTDDEVALSQQTDEAIELSQYAMGLYRGDFLGQVTGADWTTTERNRLRARFVQLSIYLGELLAGRGDHGPALAVVDPVLNMEPWNEDAAVIKMHCHALTGARSMAVAAYRSCAEALSTEFGTMPAAQTTRAYEEIRGAGPNGRGGGLTAVRSRTVSRPPLLRALGAARSSR